MAEALNGRKRQDPTGNSFFLADIYANAGLYLTGIPNISGSKILYLDPTTGRVSYADASGSTSLSASYALTASYLEGTIASASFATSASRAVSASYALSSSFAQTARSASYALSASFVESASFAATSSTTNIIDTAVGGDHVLIFADGSGVGKQLRAETGSLGPKYNPTNNELIAYNADVVSTLNVGGNATVEGNLTVNGEIVYINVKDLYVEDRFIALASGSTSGGVDGGIGVVSGSAAILGYTGIVGYGLAYKASTNRWGLQTNMPLSGSIADGAVFVPDNYMVSVRQASGVPHATTPTYGGSSTGYGNLYVDSATGDIYIYS